MQTGNPVKLELVATKVMEDRLAASRLEKEIHVYHNEYHVNGEWFELSEDAKEKLIKNYEFIKVDE